MIILQPIGTVRVSGEGFRLVLEPEFAPALLGLEGFSHLQALWWCSLCDGPPSRGKLLVGSPYPGGPQTLGTFATRSPERPNPIALSVAQILCVDPGAGTVELAYLDALDGTPLLDIKPYTPSLDRVGTPRVPPWCAHWPGSLEASADFDWGEVFG